MSQAQCYTYLVIGQVIATRMYTSGVVPSNSYSCSWAQQRHLTSEGIKAETKNNRIHVLL